ncbi:Acyl-CoA thioester hydrolase / Bile acid-CoA amino acid N-acetyltransferase [Teladorsagia circumcincta]|uniref:Acyl-CoA thioester hydrolase / Bile acid-CoA amino acid N-acetyltransferase n=1 Tax=Teladorsagia circumcincta TaxID=45464 RepID=A0A2G9U6T1_TELCI|nr:Acyl-CoA thioester hydrolase / Bile acid-CoA amino acid N-acetyltransferase [Teladorsagia circumcincta]
MSLYVDVHDSMQNERLHIRATHLAPNGIYKLVLRADSVGEIDVPTAKPLRGSYSEADPMGLFMSIEPCDDFPFGGYLRCTPPIPFIYNLILLDSGDRELAMVPIKKHWMHPNLERIEIEEDGFCGTLFKPPGRVLWCHNRSSSSYTISPGKYHTTDLVVGDLCRPTIPRKRGKVPGCRLDAVVAINGPHVLSDYVNIKENGKLIPQGQLADSKIRFINGIMASDRVIRHTTFDETTEIPWHRTSPNTSFRIVIHLINGGHIVEPPYFPHHGAVYAKFQGFYCGYGGDPILHGKSQEVSWQGTIDFFKRKLGKTAVMPDWDRLHHATTASHL